MKPLAFKIAKLRELQELKEASEARESAVMATFEDIPSDIPDSEEKPPEAPKPSNGNGNEPKPKSLEGMSLMTMQLLYTDGQMSEKERTWFQKKTIRRAQSLHPLDWMRF